MRFIHNAHIVLYSITRKGFNKKWGAHKMAPFLFTGEIVPKKSNTKEFIEKAIKKHQDTYDYSLVKYESNVKKIKIICKIHGIFEQTPANHLTGYGCFGCGGFINSNTDEFIDKAKNIHGNRYDYSLVDYKKSHIKVKIICSKHGIFEQSPSKHLEGQNCSKCSGNVKKTREEFVLEAKKVHQNKYDYSLVEYINGKTNVKIICPEHGVFEKTPVKHTLRKEGCHQCALFNRANINRKSTDDFIKKSKKVHGNKYDYSEVDYKGSTIKVKITCPIHGLFEKLPSNHFKGQGCPKCLIIISHNKSNTEDFIKKSKEKHGDLYDYSLTNYVKANKKVEIICKKHGSFMQTPQSHLSGRGCDKCGGSKKLEYENILKRFNEIHNNFYYYDKFVYVNAVTKSTITCPIHGDFEQKPANHLQGQGCIKCAGVQKKTKEDFIKDSILIHGSLYDYSLVEYKNAFEKVKIICRKHGPFIQVPSLHLCGSGCPTCRESTGEKFIAKFLQENNINFVRQKKFDDCKHVRLLSFDFYLPDHNICIEYNGIQHYEMIQRSKDKEKNIKIFNGIKVRDNIKKEYCKNNNIELLIISYKEDVKTRLHESKLI